MAAEPTTPGRACSVAEALARCFASEMHGPMFTLMGSANMHFLSHLKRTGVSIVRVHHENMALAMADGSFRSTGEVGTCSVTSGPGLTQIATGLKIAEHRKSAIVILAGDSDDRSSVHWMDQRRFIEASGGTFLPVRSAATVATDVREAFEFARVRGTPVVLNASVELQAEDAHESAISIMPGGSRCNTAIVSPSASSLSSAADLVLRASRPVIVAGRGAMAANAGTAIEALGERVGALLATTLPAKGLFAGNPYDLGVIGACGNPAAARVIENSDCVISFGVSFDLYSDSEKLFHDVVLLSVNLDPGVAVPPGRKPDLSLKADAGVAAAELDRVLAGRLGVGVRSGYRSAEMRRILDEDSLAAEMLANPGVIQAGTVDPRLAMLAIDRILPDDCTIVVSGSHCGYFPMRFISGSRTREFIATTEFGSIGHGMSTAIGIAIARPGRPVIVFEGDGATMMSIQELHTAATYGARVLVVVMNDEAFGSEMHRLGNDPDGYELSRIPSPDYAQIGRAMGVTSTTAHTIADAVDAVRGFLSGPCAPHMVDVRISQGVVRPRSLRRPVT